MKKITYDLDCGDLTCDECRHFSWISEPECTLFLENHYPVDLHEQGFAEDNNDKRFLRCTQCLAAEQKGSSNES